MPETSDSTQDGIILPPATMSRLIAREEAWRVIAEHARSCPLATGDVEARLRGVEISLGRLIGFMLGAGILGGAAGGVVAAGVKAIAP